MGGAHVSSNPAFFRPRFEVALRVTASGRVALPIATRCREPLAGEPCGIVRGEEHGDAGDVVRLSDAAKRRTCDHRFFEIAAHDAAAVPALGLDAARRNRVDPDFSWTQFRGEPACYCIHRAFGPGIDRGRRLSRACNRAYVDDAAAIRPEVLDRYFGGEDRMLNSRWNSSSVMSSNGTSDRD